MNCLVLGLGNIGKATAWAMKKLGFVVDGFDTDKQAIEDGLRLKYIDKSFDWTRHMDSPIFDIVVSCLPYDKNFGWARWCIVNNLRYSDLGGSVDIENQIIDHANKYATNSVFPSLGLAPGLISILAEREFAKFPVVPTDVHLYCGGMCQKEQAPVYYKSNWSLPGLINEYYSPVELLEDSKIITVPGLSRKSCLITTFHNGRDYVKDYSYDAACTSGGLSNTAKLMQKRGVKNCSYSTLRNVGHYRFLKFLDKTMGYTKEQITDFLSKACKYDESDRDKVIIAIRISRDNLLSRYDYELLQNENNKFSCMQRLTAFTIASVADLMCKGKMPDKKVYDYSDVPFEEFNKNMQTLGIELS